MKISRRIIILLVVGFLLWAFVFAPWEISIYDDKNPEIGKRVSFDVPLLLLQDIPDKLAGTTIRRKYNAAMVTQAEWEYVWGFDNVSKTPMPVDTIYSVEAIFTKFKVGALPRAYNEPMKIYVLKSPRNMLIPTREALYEGYEKHYH